MPTKEDILDSIANMTVLELSELLKDFEEKFGVTAAAPVAVAAAAPGRWRRRGRRRGGEGRVRRRPHRGRRQEDPGHQGGARADEPRPQGGQGPRRRCPQPRPGEGVQGGRREGQGRPRGGRRQGRAQVADPPHALHEGPAARPGLRRRVSGSRRARDGAAGTTHSDRLPGDLGDAVEVLVVVQDASGRRARPRRRRRGPRCPRPGAAPVRQLALDLDRPVERVVADGDAGNSRRSRSSSSWSAAGPGAEEQLQVDEAAGGDRHRPHRGCPPGAARRSWCTRASALVPGTGSSCSPSSRLWRQALVGGLAGSKSSPSCRRRRSSAGPGPAPGSPRASPRRSSRWWWRCRAAAGPARPARGRGAAPSS